MKRSVEAIRRESGLHQQKALKLKRALLSELCSSLAEMSKEEPFIETVGGKDYKLSLVHAFEDAGVVHLNFSAGEDELVKLTLELKQ